MKNNEKNEVSVDDLIKAYNLLVSGIETKANEDEERAYGGIVRAGKGLLVENLAKRIIKIAWEKIGGESNRLSIRAGKIKIPIKEDYIPKIKNPDVKKFIQDNLREFNYKINPDVQVYIDDKLFLVTECKAYTENAMLKRILVDFTLLKQVYPDIKCVLFQLESQLGGDYSEINKRTTICGSYSTHTLMSYFDIDLHIITLLEGERRVDEPIHKSEFYKELKKESLLKSISVFEKILKKGL